MAIVYNVTEREEPGVKGGGKKKFYAKIVFDGEFTVDDRRSKKSLRRLG